MAEQTEFAYDLFISYADADRAWVEGYLLDALRRPAPPGEAGTQPGVRFHSEAAFALGAPRLLEFERAIKQSRRTLLVLSPAYLADGFTQFTDLLAQSYGLETATWPVIPLILHPLKLPPRLAMLIPLDATDPDQWPAVLERLCGELQRPVPGPSPKPPCPYPGMVPFSEADSDRFYGRDREVQELLERLRLHPFLTVIGPSGSGKSSLVFAGLIPALRGSGLFGPGQWLVRSLRPGQAPLDALTAALEGDAADPVQALSKLLPTGQDARRLLLVVDQFEELFTLVGQGTGSFQQALLRLAETPSCYLVLTVRADFYPDLMATPLWTEIQAHRAEVLPLDDEGLRQAVFRPAEDVGVFVETALVERLVADAADEPGVLPLVQETLVILWERVERRFLPLSAYEALVLPRSAYGGPPRTGLQVAMARRADAALGALAPAQQRMARRILLRLVQFGEGRADTRRQQRVTALHAAGDDSGLFEQTLRHLTDNRLLTLSGEEGDPDRQVDIAHEALISGWPRLGEWLTERRDAEQTRRRIEDKAAEWVRLGRGSGGLLDETELPEAERWLASPDSAELGASQALTDLVVASRAAIEGAIAQRRRAARLRLGAVGAIATLIIIALGIALWSAQRNAENLATIAESQQQLAQQERNAAATAESFAREQQKLAEAEATARAEAEAQRDRAEEQTRLALSRELAASALAQMPLDAELGRLLALEAAEAGETAEAERALRQGMLNPLLTVLRGHARGINNATFSPNGKWAITASIDQTVRLWDTNTWETAAILPGNYFGLANEAFTSDGRAVVIDGPAGRTAFDTATWEPIPIPAGLEEETTPPSLSLSPGEKTAAFSQDGRLALTTDDDGNARIWQTATGEVLAPLGGDTPSRESGKVAHAAFSPDGELLVTTTGFDDTAELWKVATGGLVSTLSGHTGPILDVAFSPDSRLAATAASYPDNTARVWDVVSVQTQAGAQTVAELRGHASFVNTVRFSPDGRLLITSSDDNTARVWEPGAGQNRVWHLQQKDPINSTAFSPDGRLLIVVGGTLAQVWDVRTREVVAELRGHTDAIISAAFDPESKWVVTGSGDSTARVWDAATGKTLAELAGHTGPVLSARFSPDGTKVVTAGDNTARVWLASTGQLAAELRGHAEAVSSAAFSPDGTWVVTASRDQTARVWETSSGRLVQELRGQNRVNHAEFSPDSTLVVTTGWDPGGRVWEASTGRVVADLDGHTVEVNMAAFSSDGKFIVTASGDNTAKIWETDTGRMVADLLGHVDEVQGSMFSPDGRFVLTASEDRTARLFDAQTGQSLIVFRGHASEVGEARFSPNGKLIATSSIDGKLQVFACDVCGGIKELVPLVRARVFRELTCQERGRFLHQDAACP